MRARADQSSAYTHFLPLVALAHPCKHDIHDFTSRKDVKAKSIYAVIHIHACFRECIASRITDVNSTHVNLGGVLPWAKTAACAVCFDLDSVSFLLIATCLATGRQPKDVEQRNQACASIDQALLRLLCPATAVGATRQATAREKRAGGKLVGRISSATALFDRVFWMGGLNYEMDATCFDVERCVCGTRACA